MGIREIKENKRDYLPLLLLADEQEDMIERYLHRGTMFVLEEDGAVIGECVVTDEGGGALELQNLAVAPERQRQGYGRQLLTFLCDRYRGSFRVLLLGTGDSPRTLPFYERCGFTKYRRLKNYYLEHYDHPIFEDGRQLRDKIYLKKTLSAPAEGQTEAKHETGHGNAGSPLRVKLQGR